MLSLHGLSHRPARQALSRHLSVCRRDFIPLCARLLGVSAQGLNENPGVVAFTVLANVVMAALVVPIMGFSGLAVTNGQLVPNRAPPPLLQCSVSRAEPVQVQPAGLLAL